MSAIEQKQLANPPLCKQGLAEIIQQLASIAATSEYTYRYSLEITADIYRRPKISLTVFDMTRTDSEPHGNKTLWIYQSDSQLLALRKKAVMADMMRGNIPPDRFRELAKELEPL